MSIGMFAKDKIDVAGLVFDEQGTELIGVSVQVQGSQGIGVVTDIDGRFKLSGIPVGSKLVFSYIGYMPQEVKYVSTKLKERITLKAVSYTHLLGTRLISLFSIHR